MNVAVGADLPREAAILGGNGVQVGVVGPDQNLVPRGDGRRLDLRTSLERPHGLTGRGINRVQQTREIADVDDAIRYGWR